MRRPAAWIDKNSVVFNLEICGVIPYTMNDSSGLPGGTIKKFYDRGTEDLFFKRNTKQSRRKLPKNLHGKARRILNNLHECSNLSSLRIHEIKYIQNTPADEDWFELRINRQYRIYFLWAEGAAKHVRVDDHL